MKISIIVPVFNTAQYLGDCVDSLLEQTYPDIEVLLIDDGSTDDSLNICKEYAEKDSRVTVFHKENTGVSDTRNFGIEMASGELISFCDSDDIIVPELYQKLYNIMCQSGMDRVVSGYMYLYEGSRTVYCKPRLPDGKYNSKDLSDKMIDDGTLSGFLFSGVCNSLFKKEIIDGYNIRFDTRIKYNEDSLFSFLYLLHSNGVYSVQSEGTYYYRQHNTSSTKRRVPENKYIGLHDALKSINGDMRIPNFDDQMRRRHVTEALWSILDYSEKEEPKKAIKHIRSIVKDEALIACLPLIQVKELNVYKKVYYLLIKMRMAVSLFFVSSKLVPLLSKHISR